MTGENRTGPDHADAADGPFFSGQRKRLLLVASTGGHLSQLVRLARREGAADDSMWVTFDSPQSRSMLAGKRVTLVDYVAPRDLRGTVSAYRRLEAALDPAEFDGALSTGAAVGLAGLAWARRHGLPRVYVESVSRTDGPSLTGRIVRRLGLASTYTQHRSWATRAWRPTASVLQDFDPPNPYFRRKPGQSLRIFVTLGTIRPYRFDRLVDRVVEISRPGDEIVWQLGETNRGDLPGRAHELIGADEMLDISKASDVVITHSGVGTILQLLDAGISPVVVPRRRAHGEHVDDHQLQIWRLLRDSGIAFPVEVDELTRETLAASASARPRRSEQA